MANIENTAVTVLTSTEKLFFSAKTSYLFHVEEYHAYAEAEYFYGVDALSTADRDEMAHHKNLADHYSKEMAAADNKLRVSFYR